MITSAKCDQIRASACILVLFRICTMRVVSLRSGSSAKVLVHRAARKIGGNVPKTKTRHPRSTTHAVLTQSMSTCLLHAPSRSYTQGNVARGYMTGQALQRGEHWTKAQPLQMMALKMRRNKCLAGEICAAFGGDVLQIVYSSDMIDWLDIFGCPHF